MCVAIIRTYITFCSFSSICCYVCIDILYLPLSPSPSPSTSLPPLPHAPLSPSHAVSMTVKANDSVTVYKGDPLRLYCVASGNPTPSVLLVRILDNYGLNDEFQYNEKIFAVSEAMPEHAGTYVCLASQYTFDVNDLKPTPSITNSHVTMTVSVLGECIS